MIYRLYERLLHSQIKKSNLPNCVAVVLDSGDLSGNGLNRLLQLLEWSLYIRLPSLMLYVSDDDPSLCHEIASRFCLSPEKASPPSAILHMFFCIAAE